MVKYVIYARKSTESEDRQVLSIESQIREVSRLAQLHGVSVSEVMSESRSAKAPGRPVFGELMRRVQRGEISGVLCWKMDRLSRNPLDSGVLLQAQADGKLERIITSDGVKTADSNDRLMGTFELAFATKYIDDLRANVKRGNRARFEKGWPNFRPPIGYLEDSVKKTIIKDPERFDLVRKMWDMLLQGARPKHITLVARDEWGLRTPRHGSLGGALITPAVAYRLFTDRYFAGYIDLIDGRQYLGAHEPMITLDEYEQAQRLLGRRAHPLSASHENALAGIIRCGNCGCSVVAEFHTKNGRQYIYHRCSRSKPGVRCREKPISEPRLKGQLVDFMQRIAVPPPVLSYLRDKLNSHDAGGASHARMLAAQREKALASIEREERELLGLRVRQLIDDETFTRERASLQHRRAGLEQASRVAHPHESEALARAKSLASQLDLIEGGRLLVEKGQPFQLRSLVTGLQLEMSLQGRRLDFKPSEPLATLVRAASDSNWWASWSELWKWVQFGAAPRPPRRRRLPLSVPREAKAA
jgi:site-specific DNA recombinase